MSTDLVPAPVLALLIRKVKIEADFADKEVRLFERLGQ